MLVFLSLVAGAVLLLLWKVAARGNAVPGVLWHPEHQFFWGSTPYFLRRVMRDKATTTYEEHLRCHRANGWRPYGKSMFADRVLVHVLAPSDVKHVLKDAFPRFEKAQQFQDIFAQLLGDGIFNSNGLRWKEQRIVASHLFNRRQLRDRMSHVFGTHAQQLVRVLKESDGRSVEVQPFFYHFTFDAINSVAFNRHVNSLLGNPEDMAFQEAFDACQRAMVSRFVVPFWKVCRAFQSSAAERVITESLKVIDEYVYRVVDGYVDAQGRARDTAEDDQTLTGLFLQHAQEEGKAYPREFIRNMILNFVIAGRDTTASGLTSCVEYLTDPRYQHWQGKLRAEAMSVFGSSLSDPLTYDDLADKTPVSEAVFLEALRLHPPVPSNEKICVETSEFPSGFTLPKGVFIGWCPISTNRMPAIWGENADGFDPARWITPAGAITTQYDDYTYPTFNAGPRLCLGKNMAILEAKIALLTLFAHLSFTRCPESMPPKPVMSVTWQIVKGFRVVVHLVENPPQ